MNTPVQPEDQNQADSIVPEIPAPKAPEAQIVTEEIQGVPKSPLEALQEEALSKPTPVISATKENDGLKTDKTKRLHRMTSVRVEGEDRPLFGKAYYKSSPYTTSPHGERIKKENDGRIPIFMPTLGLAGVRHYSQEIRGMDYVRDPDALHWAEVQEATFEHTSVRDALMPAMNREDSKWTNTPEGGGRELTISNLKARPSADPKMSAQSALNYAMSALGLGTPVEVPLWHSGIWLRVRPASDDQWVAFNEKLTQDKIRFGRNTSGLIFSNINAIFMDRCLDLVLQNVMWTSVRLEGDDSIEQIKKKILTPDIPAVLWALMAASHPDGYPITRACSSAVGDCKAVLEEIINLSPLQVTDDSVINPELRAHMAKARTDRVSEQEVDLYQSKLLTNQPEEVTIIEKNGLTLRAKLKVPNSQQYIDNGNAWIDGVVSMVNQILAKDSSDAKREERYAQHAKTSILREYSHWIDCLYVNDIEVTESAGVETLLTNLTAQGELRTNFYRVIRDYIEKCTMSVIAIPNYHCPVCKQKQRETKDTDRFQYCIPLDVAQVFFSLALLRFTEISNRS